MQNLSTFPAPVREPPPTMPAVPEIKKETVPDYLKAFGLATQLTESEKLQFIEIAQAFGLNPFKREVHVAVYCEGEYRKLSIITGYEVYLKRADRTCKRDGWRAWIEGEGEGQRLWTSSSGESLCYTIVTPRFMVPENPLLFGYILPLFPLRALPFPSVCRRR